MKLNRYMLLPLAVAAVGLPSLSHAAHVQPVYGEIGYTYYPNQSQSIKSRQEVVAENEAARKDGTMWLALRGVVPLPVKSTAPGKTRQQVLDELQTETVAVRHARMFQ